MRTALLGSAMLIVAACSEEDSRPGFRSTDWFRSHPVERAETIQRCEHGVDGYQTAHQEECGTAEAAQAMQERAADAAARRKH